MSDETTTPPVEGTAPAPAAQTTTEPTYTHAEVLKILEAERGAATPADPVAKFRATVGAKRPEPTPAAPSRIESMLEGLLALQIAAHRPPAPPAPPKAMTTSEKFASTDPDVYLRRGANAWTQADTAALASDIAKARGVSLEEASAQARKQIIARTQEVAGNVRVNVTSDPFAAIRGGK